MAWNQQRNRIFPECGAHGAHGLGKANLARHPGVGTHFAVRNVTNLLQDPALERCQSAKFDSSLEGSLACEVIVYQGDEQRRRFGLPSEMQAMAFHALLFKRHVIA